MVHELIIKSAPLFSQEQKTILRCIYNDFCSGDYNADLLIDYVRANYDVHRVSVTNSILDKFDLDKARVNYMLGEPADNYELPAHANELPVAEKEQGFFFRYCFPIVCIVLGGVCYFYSQ